MVQKSNRENIMITGGECVGCRSCEQVCPTGCIVFKPDEEGFLYPKVEEEQCIRCGKCLRHCPVLFRREEERQPEMYGVRNKNAEHCSRSASAGVADMAAREMIAAEGSVFGCAYTDEWKAEHREIKAEKDLWKIQSSKYVQSDIGRCYETAKARLKEGKKVLFTGTPCQIAGLYAYLGAEKENENLITIDLICHGVPSPLLWEKYLNYQQQKMGGRVTECNFRDKGKKGWGTNLRIRTEKKDSVRPLSLDRYGIHFLEGDCYRESCYQCRYASTDRVGDLTCGDFWGVEKVQPQFLDTRGVSVVLVNSEKGKAFFEKIKEQAVVLEVKSEEILPFQGNLVHPTRRPKLRDTFYQGINENGYIEKLKVGLRLSERIKALLPKKVTIFLKGKLK